MKKLFAIVFTSVLILCSLTAQAGFISEGNQEECTDSQSYLLRVTDDVKDDEMALDMIQQQYSESSINLSCVTDNMEDSKLTLDMIRQMPSWEVLVDTTVPISGYKNIINKEDLYTVMFIKSSDHKLVAPIYHDLEYVSSALGGIRLNDINYDRLMCKFQSIIDVYNSSNELQLTWSSKILNEDYMQVHIQSTNIGNVVTEVGQTGVLKQGATYWESSSADGSGKHGNVSADNPHIPKDLVVTINGFAYLDENRTHIVESYYTPYERIGKENVQISPWERRMLHISTENGDIGWVYAEDIARLD